MGTNYYIKKQKENLDSDQYLDFNRGYEEIHSLLMEKIKSKNVFVSEWANESLFKLKENQREMSEYIHIGKNSSGHRFTLNSKNFKRWIEWREYLKEFSDLIVDEYDNKISLEELNDIVNNSLKNKIVYNNLMLSLDGFYLQDQEFC